MQVKRISIWKGGVSAQSRVDWVGAVEQVGIQNRNWQCPLCEADTWENRQ